MPNDCQGAPLPEPRGSATTDVRDKYRDDPMSLRLFNMLELAWGIIANVEWADQSPEWQDAAARWRDEQWHPLLDELLKVHHG